MKKKTLTALLLIVSTILIGCGNNNKVDEKEEIKNIHEDNFTKIEATDIEDENTDIPDENTDTEEDNLGIALDIPDEYKNLDIYEEKEEMHEQNENAHISDDKTSNIDFNMEKIISTPLTDYEWLDVNKEDYDYYEIYQWIGYAIKEYNNNSIVGVYRCNIPDDIIDEETTMVFTVRVYSSEAVDLDIWLDLYNNKIIVTESQE